MSTDIANFTPTTDVFADANAFDLAQRVAKVLASSDLVPSYFKGKVSDCLIALQIARRLDENPLTVMQNIFIIGGRPGWLTSYMVSRANRSGVFRGRITWDETGSNGSLSVTAKAVMSDTGELVTVTCDMAMAQAEGWTKNSKYRSMPSHMLKWRSASMLIRLYVPEVMLGIPTSEENETMPPPSQAMRDVTPAKTTAQSLDDFAASMDVVLQTESEVMPSANLGPRENNSNATPPRLSEAPAESGVADNLDIPDDLRRDPGIDTLADWDSKLTEAAKEGYQALKDEWQNVPAGIKPTLKQALDRRHKPAATIVDKERLEESST